jgi:hypothetical protein
MSEPKWHLNEIDLALRREHKVEVLQRIANEMKATMSEAEIAEIIDALEKDAARLPFPKTRESALQLVEALKKANKSAD